MSVSAIIVTTASSNAPSASFKLSLREQKSPKVTYNSLLAPMTGLTNHSEHCISYTAASTVKLCQALVALHGTNPCAPLDKRCRLFPKPGHSF